MIRGNKRENKFSYNNYTIWSSATSNLTSLSSKMHLIVTIIYDTHNRKLYKYIKLQKG